MLLVHVPQKEAKLKVVKFLLFGFTLQPLDAHGQVVAIWKPSISHCLEPGVHRIAGLLWLKTLTPEMANL